MKNIAVFWCFLFFTTVGFAQQLTYKPINPAFGGNSFNYQWLLSSAESQNTFKDPEAGRNDASGLNNFSENLNRQLLGQLSRSLLGSQIGDNLQPGSFVFGDLAVEVVESAEGLVINILDLTTGEQTQVVVPN
jgi:curli production assembly/transport component CsgF